MADSSMLHLSRRSVLATVVAAGGGLMLGFPVRSGARAAQSSADQSSMLSAFIRIDPTGDVTLILPYVEMGQGAYTSQIQVVSEELEVDPRVVAIEAAPPDQTRYASPILGDQITGGSASLRGSWQSMRTAAAAARTMLVDAAAQRWSVPAQSCVAAQGRVSHGPSGRSAHYGDLVAAAALLPAPSAPRLKSKNEFKVVGLPMKRHDTPDKITGAAKFSIDAQPPGLRYAMVQACPVFGGTLASVKDSDALAVKGVHKVVQLPNAVAVVASNTWAARKGLAALRIVWNEGSNAKLSTADLTAQADAALDKPGLIATNTGNVSAAEGKGKRYEAVFRLPMLAHAAMEPLNCTVHVQADRCEVWLGSQILGRAHKTVAAATGLPPERVVLHNHFLGGGFGRRLEVDYVEQAALIAKQIDGPVKVTWSREEDIRQDYYRYLNHSRVTVALNDAGQPMSWRHKLVGPNIMARWLPAYQSNDIDLDIVDCAHGPYDIDNVHIEFTRNEAPTGLGTGNWRGVGPTRNVVIVESVIDDLAHRVGKDPIAYRKAIISNPRIRAVLAKAEAESNWNAPLPPRSGRGIAVFTAFGSYLAMIAQVSVLPNGSVRVDRITCAVDAGIVVNPDIVRAQVEGGVIFGLSAVLWGKVTVANGRVEQGNFNDYRVMRIQEAPPIDVHIMDSAEDPGGIGEPGTCGAIAAVANAVFAATGKRLYTLPMDPAALRENA